MRRNYTEREIYLIEKSFEEGYAVAKRLYKPISIRYVTEHDLNGNDFSEFIKRRNKKATNYKNRKPRGL
jgi:hypothetical protein